MIKTFALTWQQKPPFLYALPANFLEWIYYPKSFMNRLKQFGVEDATVEVLFQGYTFPKESDRKKLQLGLKAYVLQRDVLISTGNTKLMCARTVIPIYSLTGKNAILKLLKQQSLGSLLFKDPKLQRSDFEFAQCELNHPDKKCIARRSVFNYHQKPILLTEVYFPDVAKL